MSERLENSSLVTRAKDFAQKAHEGQQRLDGTPYFSHCEAVAKIISEEWGIRDENLICAAYLHDTIEDTKTTLDEIKINFSDEVASLIDGVSKFRSEKEVDKKIQDRETIKKVSGRNLLDPGVTVLKLADRLHNMRTLNFVPEAKQIPKARETLDIYAKLAESLGMWEVMRQLEDLAFKYVDRPEYERLLATVENDPRIGELLITHTVSLLESMVRESGIGAQVVARENSLWGIRQKLEKQQSNLKVVNDVVSFRIFTDNRDDCYKLLGRIREAFRESEIPEKFSDYFAHPADNGYSAIQLTINTPQGQVEIAITTKDKEEFNNWGVVSLIKKGEKDLAKYALKLIFTPIGHVKFFPLEATGVDFAYKIDSSLGASAIYVLVDGVKEPLSYVVPNGNVMEVITGEPKVAPDPQLADYSLAPTRKIIEEQLADLGKEEQIIKGEAIVEDILREQSGLLDLIDLYSFEDHMPKLKRLLYNLGAKGSLRNLYYLVGSGFVKNESLSGELVPCGITKDQLNLSTISLEGIDRLGIMEEVGVVLGRMGVNIGALDLRRRKVEGKMNFSFRLVVENLNEELEKKLAQKLKIRCKIEKVLIV